MTAAREGNERVVKILLDHGANVDSMTTVRRTTTMSMSTERKDVGAFAHSSVCSQQCTCKVIWHAQV